jgi:murein DD-endopeptidase MepM/ murein hydrolase activator NlpD
MIKHTAGYLVFLLLSIGCVLFLKASDKKEIKSDADLITLSNLSEIPEVKPRDGYGYEIGLYEIRKSKIRRNESFYSILSNLELSPADIHLIEKELQGQLDPRQILPGQRYITYVSSESAKPVSMVYHPNALVYILIDWEDQIRVERGKREATTVLRSATGRIESSLYQTLSDNDITPLLAYELSEIFAWQIDFFRLYKGDHFKVIYEERYVDDELLGIGRITAAEFVHRGEAYQVYNFEHPEQYGYFDAEGNSVQKVLLKAPFRYSQRISSGFSHSRFHPVLKRKMPHYGIDYAAPLGTPVISVGDGEVIEAGHRGPNGNIVKIRHNGVYTTAYLHLDGFARGIQVGSRVKQGQVIGYVGDTGRVTGVHLDYRVYVNDRPVNPLRLNLPPSKAVEDSLRDEFERQKNKLKEKLEQLKLPDHNT